MNQPLTKMNILIVDDDQMSLDVLMRILNILGANVTPVKSGQQALTVLQDHNNNRPDFILADLSMPKMSGWDFNIALKNDPSLADLAIIVLTANASLDTQNQVKKSGFDGFIAKPISIKTFPTILIDILKTIPSLADIIQE